MQFSRSLPELLLLSPEERTGVYLIPPPPPWNLLFFYPLLLRDSLGEPDVNSRSACALLILPAPVRSVPQHLILFRKTNYVASHGLDLFSLPSLEEPFLPFIPFWKA